MAANASETSPPTTETAAAPEVALTPAATTPPPAPPHDDDESAPPPNAPIDPKVAQLAALFPATSNDIIEAVLAAVGGSLEQATETLLSMNDPSFAEPQQSQFDSDAEFARNLAAQDDHQRRQRNPSPPSSNLPYRPYVPRRRGAPPMGFTGGEGHFESGQGEAPRPKDELDQLTEGFAKLADKGSKLAEQGAKTLGSFFNKVKDQINSLDGGSGPQASTSSGAPFTPAPTSQPAPNQSWSAPVPLPRPEPQTRSSGTSVVPELLPRPKPTSPRVAATPPPATTSTPSPPIASASKEVTPEEPRKDFSKIGLLPRQSVSLLDSKNKKDHDSDDDDLEYVRSPFDDD